MLKYKPMLRELSQSLRAHRLRRNWTQRQLSEASGVSEKYIARLENGHNGAPSNVSVAVLFKLAGALEVPPLELLRVGAPAQRRRAGKPVSMRRISDCLARMDERKAKVLSELIEILDENETAVKGPAIKA